MAGKTPLAPVTIGSILLLLSLCLAAAGQQSAQPPLLKEGTPIKLRVVQGLNSKTASEGDPVDLVLDEDLKLDNVTIAPAGAKAAGHVTQVKKAGMAGKRGELNIALDNLIVRDSKVRIRGDENKAKGGTDWAGHALTAAFGVAGLLHHGNDAEIKAGTRFVAYLDQDFALPTAAAASPAPNATAPAATAPPPGQLVLVTTPPAAQVYLDDEFKGISGADGKLIIRDIKPGAHMVRMIATGYTELRQPTVVIAGDNPLVLTATAATSGPKPLTAPEVEKALHDGLSKPRVTALVREYGVDFDLTDEIERRLRIAGADDAVLLAISKSRKR